MRTAQDAFAAPSQESSHVAYLEKVRHYFADKPEVYNRFIDVMRHYNSGAYVNPQNLRLPSILLGLPCAPLISHF